MDKTKDVKNCEMHHDPAALSMATWQHLGIQLNEAPNEISLAIHRFEKSVTMNQNASSAYTTATKAQTDILNRASIFDRAVAAYLRTSNISPNNAIVYGNLGGIYYDR